MSISVDHSHLVIIGVSQDSDQDSGWSRRGVKMELMLVLVGRFDADTGGKLRLG